MAAVSKFSAEQRARAVRMVLEAAPGYPTQWPAIVSVAEKIGVSAETLRSGCAGRRSAAAPAQV